MYICSTCSSGQFLFSCKFSFLLVRCRFYSATNIDRTILRESSLLVAGNHLQSGMQAARVAAVGSLTESSVWLSPPGRSVRIHPFLSLWAATPWHCRTALHRGSPKTIRK